MAKRLSSSVKRLQEQSQGSKRKMATWFMAFLMISSIFGFILMDQSQDVTNLDYNEFKIESSTAGYVVRLNKTTSVLTSDHPLSLEKITVEKPVWDLLTASRVLGVTYNQSDERADAFGAAQFLLEKDLLVAKRMFIQRGLFNASETDLQTFSCKDASPAFPVMVLEVGDQTKAFLDGSCIHVQGIVAMDVLRVSDRIILGLAGVMPRE